LWWRTQKSGYHTFEIFNNFVKNQVYEKMAITPLLAQKFAIMTWGLSIPLKILANPDLHSSN